jgi:hypothetical protein
MHRIATTVDAAAADAAMRLPPSAHDISQPVMVRSAKVLSLLLILEALRQSPTSLDRAKV